MAKRGIEWHIDYDRRSRWRMIIEKRRGKLTLDEIRETAREYGEDY